MNKKSGHKKTIKQIKINAGGENISGIPLSLVSAPRLYFRE
jgi:hypothetical protein